MSVVTDQTQSKPMEIDTNDSNNSNNNSNNNSPSKTPGKRKKDYVYKFWMALYARCEPIITEYIKTKAMQNNEQSNNNNNNNNNNINDESKSNDIEMKDASNSKSNNNSNNDSVDSNSLSFTFEQLGAFMGNKQLIALVGKFWAVLKAYIENERIGKESIKDARIILSTLMIAMFPSDVLDVAYIKDMDALSEACFNAAHNVIDTVFSKHPEKMTMSKNNDKFTNDDNGNNNESSSVNNNNEENVNHNRLHCQQAYKAIIDFMNAFKDWQLQDKTKILESVLNFYEQWQRSYKVLQMASLNQAQKDAILKTINVNINNCKNKMVKLVGNDEMVKLCAKIDEKLENEDTQTQTQNNNNNTNNTDPTATMASMANNINNNNNNNNNNSNNTGNNTSKSIEEQLKARGVPVNMKTGTNLLGGNTNNSEENNNNNDNMSGISDEAKKYVTKDENGNNMLNLDEIIMEEASKKYWSDFEKEIENENWSRLFELLSEILERVKKLSPKSTHAMLDDMIDVSFIQQTINKGLIDASGFYGIFHGIWQQLRSLHAPAQDSKWDEWHDQILKDMSASDATWAKLLSQVFNTFLLKCDEIEDQIKVINHIKAKNK